jgi:hypothetical protein
LSIPLDALKGVVALGALAARHLFGAPIAGIFKCGNGAFDPLPGRLFDSHGAEPVSCCCSTFLAVPSVASLFVFSSRPDWQKLGVVSFASQLLPAFFVAVGIWMRF